MKKWLKYAWSVLRLKYGRQRFYTKKPLHLIPYWEGDIVITIPASLIGKIKFILNPLRHFYIYVDKWKFSNYKFDAEVRQYGHAVESIIDVREERFHNNFIIIHRRAKHEIRSPEDELVLFWWKKLYYKRGHLFYVGELE